MKTKKSLLEKVINLFPSMTPLQTIIVPVEGYKEFVAQQQSVAKFFKGLRAEHIKKACNRFLVQLMLTLLLLFVAAIYFNLPFLPVLGIMVVAYIIWPERLLTSAQIKKAAEFTKELPYGAQYFNECTKGIYCIGVQRKDDMVHLYDITGTKIFAIQADGDIAFDEFEDMKRKKCTNSFSSAAQMRQVIGDNLNVPYWRWHKDKEWSCPITAYAADEYGRTNDMYHCILM